VNKEMEKLKRDSIADGKKMTSSVRQSQKPLVSIVKNSQLELIRNHLIYSFMAINLPKNKIIVQILIAIF
jgi:hypothetical protein